MKYTPLYMRHDFCQSVPRGPGWRFVDDGTPHRSGGVTWRNVETGESVTCPAIWYTFPGYRYAETLDWDAKRSDETAARKADEGNAYSAYESEYFKRQARRLRAMAAIARRNPDAPAGSIDFFGLMDPTTPEDVEAATVAAIEAGNFPT